MRWSAELDAGAEHRGGQYNPEAELLAVEPSPTDSSLGQRISESKSHKRATAYSYDTFLSLCSHLELQLAKIVHLFTQQSKWLPYLLFHFPSLCALTAVPFQRPQPS